MQWVVANSKECLLIDTSVCLYQQVARTTCGRVFWKFVHVLMSRTLTIEFLIFMFFSETGVENTNVSLNRKEKMTCWFWAISFVPKWKSSIIYLERFFISLLTDSIRFECCCLSRKHSSPENRLQSPFFIGVSPLWFATLSWVFVVFQSLFRNPAAKKICIARAEVLNDEICSAFSSL